MTDLQLEEQELGLIYGNNFVSKGGNVFTISVSNRGLHADLTFTVDPSYPNTAPEISVSVGGSQAAEFHEFLAKQAQTMIGLPMLAYLAGEAMDFLAGMPADRQVVEQQEHITQTPFSRERFLLWLDKFSREMAAKREAVKKPMTGREMFEKGLAKASAT